MAYVVSRLGKMERSLDIVELCFSFPQILYALGEFFCNPVITWLTIKEIYFSLPSSSPRRDMLKLSTMPCHPVKSEGLWRSSSACLCRHSLRLPFLRPSSLSMWSSPSPLWNGCKSQMGILYFRFRFKRVLPSICLSHILMHTHSFLLSKSIWPKSSTCSSRSLSHHSQRMESTVTSAALFPPPQPHTLWPPYYQGSICAFRFSACGFLRLCPLLLFLPS